VIEIENFVTPGKVEWAYGAMKKLRKTTKSMRVPEQAMRIARDRDSSAGAKMLKALELSANILEKVAEEQSGRTRRDVSTSFSEKVEPTELGLMKAAFTTMDKGQPDEAFCWFYAMAGLVAGQIQL
jgi:hypothetical protein